MATINVQKDLDDYKKAMVKFSEELDKIGGRDADTLEETIVWLDKTVEAIQKFRQTTLELKNKYGGNLKVGHIQVD